MEGKANINERRLGLELNALRNLTEMMMRKIYCPRRDDRSVEFIFFHHPVQILAI